jgi:hypothetical protein
LAGNVVSVVELLVNIDHFPFLVKKLFSMDLKLSCSSVLFKIGGCVEQPAPPEIPENNIARTASFLACSGLYLAPFLVSQIFKIK